MNNNKTVERTFKFNPEYVTCLNCGYNYPTNTKPSFQAYGDFCQEYGYHINSDDSHVKAMACKSWIPSGLSRQWCSTVEENDSRWYEKDSM
jgi:hypothetical protein